VILKITLLVICALIGQEEVGGSEKILVVNIGVAVMESFSKISAWVGVVRLVDWVILVKIIVVALARGCLCLLPLVLGSDLQYVALGDMLQGSSISREVMASKILGRRGEAHCLMTVSNVCGIQGSVLGYRDIG